MVLSVPSVSIDSIRTKLAMTIFDEYANILKGMYSIRFNGRPDSGGTSARPDTGSSDHGVAPVRPDRDLIPPVINSLILTNLGSGRREGARRKQSN